MALILKELSDMGPQSETLNPKGEEEGQYWKDHTISIRNNMTLNEKNVTVYIFIKVKMHLKIKL